MPRLPRFEEGERKNAAVLMLFFEDSDGQARVVLTERSAGGHRHAGQISLPGGAVDDDDASVEAAALREAAEEVGLDPEQAGVELHGVLPVVDVAVSGFLVHPVIAFARNEPQLAADNYEVASVFSAPVEAFLPGSPIEQVTAERDGYRLRYGGYRIERHHVWGATGMMLSRLGAYIGAALEDRAG
jgi:8-oxo-dGTP pyrophosphatase MutT (NUDIX family)